MDKHKFNQEKTIFGFWIYLMTDLLMFGALFAAFAVLRNNTFGGVAERDLFNLQFALFETLVLLTSSFTCGLGVVALRQNNKKQVIIWFAVTLLLGLTFLYLELTEFSNLIIEGNTWQKSASLSSFFTLVGTHGLHIMVGLFWISILLVYIWRRGLTPSVKRKLTLFSLFWHFLDIVWIFIFAIVYLMGAAL